MFARDLAGSVSMGPMGHLHISILKAASRVGKYGVDVAGFEESVVPILDVERADSELFVIDEIGKMECFSERFVVAVRRLFASEKPVLATVAQKGSGLISEVKNYPNVELFALTTANRDKVTDEILEILSFLTKTL